MLSGAGSGHPPEAPDTRAGTRAGAVVMSAYLAAFAPVGQAYPRCYVAMPRTQPKELSARAHAATNRASAVLLH